MSVNSLINWNRSIFDYIANSAGSFKSWNNDGSATFTFMDTAKPLGCGNIDVQLILGFPEDYAKLKETTIAIDDPMMPNTKQAGMVEEFDLRIYSIQGFIRGQDLNYNRRLRDRLMERFRNLFSKGVYIPIKNFEVVGTPIIDKAFVVYCDVMAIKPLSSLPADQFRFVCTTNIEGLYSAS